MTANTLYKCTRCKREFNFGNIKYNEENLLVCIECLNKEQQFKKQNPDIEKPEDLQSVKFICVSCRFKFSIKKGSQHQPKCPYCAKTKLMLVRKYKTEDDLIKDSMNPRFDY